MQTHTHIQTLSLNPTVQSRLFSKLLNQSGRRKQEKCDTDEKRLAHTAMFSRIILECRTAEKMETA